ncbi:MAG: PDZ domain-containing protein [Bacteroidales bacterium]|nr:PDZ domain-containing protein [Bacteroidales bacterium]
MSVLLFVISGSGQNYDPRSTTQKYASALQIINFAYVDSVNEVDLVEKAIIASLKELDPHSQYISKKDLKRANEPLEGNFEGIGISFQIHKDTILVISPVPGGPAEKLGIMAGDKIVKIDGNSAWGSQVDNNYVFKRLRGNKGTLVNISVLRKGRKKLIEYTIKRDKIPINSIDASFMANPEVGYIKLNRFSRTTMDEFRKAIGELKDSGMESLIIDVRGNSGGYLDVAIDLSDEFLGPGKLVLYTEGSSSPRRKYKSSFRGGFEEGKVVVLIDEGSASASEIVAGALQDWDRALIIGRRSFGKGLVQRPYYLPDSSVIRLTVARYYTPTGRCIQKPYNEGYENYYDDLINRLEDGELTNADRISFPDSLKYLTPNNRLVYGGGGIMPDIFVPWDSTQYTDFYIDLLSRGIFNNFIIEYVDSKRNYLLGKYPSFEQFHNRFNIDNKFMNQFLIFAETKDTSPVGNELKLSSRLIRFQLKALIARNLYEFKSYFQVMTEIDDGFHKALEVLRQDSNFADLITN